MWVDGDKSLVVADKQLINVAKRNLDNIVPLFYNMQKAKAVTLDNKSIYAGLNAAFVGGNIGIYSNNISKIWNHDVFTSGTKEEQEKAITYVKCLCCQNNQVIDYAKTLYKTEFPTELGEKISEYTNCKLPAFFEFAKDKQKDQLEKRNNSFVNKLYTLFKNKPINTRGMKLGNIECEMMMKNKTINCDNSVIDLYNKLNSKYRYMFNNNENNITNLNYIKGKLLEEFRSFGYSDDEITDMLVYYLYTNKKRYKQLLWGLFGDIIYNNLCNNIANQKSKIIQCDYCGDYFEVGIKNTKACRCLTCQSIVNRQIKTQKQREYRQV